MPYGNNLVQNPSGGASIYPWVANIGGIDTATVVPGGTDSNGLCFRINPNGGMSLALIPPQKPKDIKITAKFYTSNLDEITPMQAYIRCEIWYYNAPDNEVFYIPCVGSLLKTVPGIVNGQSVNWVYIESICPINEFKKLASINIDLICNLTDYGYFDEIQVLPNLGDTTSAIIGGDGQIIVDESGINPDFIKSSQNMVKNSSFEQFDVSTNIPKYWTAGTSNEDASAFDGAYVLKLTPGQTTQQTTDAGMFPDSWGGGNGRLSFYHRGGAINVYVITTEGRTLPLYDKKGDPTTTVKTIPRNDGGWVRKHFGIDVSSLQANEKLLIKFTNTDNINAFIDAVQMEEDFNGIRPSFYTSGPLEATLSSYEVISKDKIIILNNQGINPYYIKHSQNLVKNSSFEISDDYKGYYWMRPRYWGGDGVMSQDVPAIDGEFVLKITNNKRSYTRVNINSLEGSNGRLSFYHRGGAVSVGVFYYDSKYNEVYIPLIDDKNQRRVIFDLPKNDNGWKRYSFGVDLSEVYTNEVIISFMSVESASPYIDAVQFEKDVSGMWPSFYSGNDDTGISIVKFSNTYWPNFDGYQVPQYNAIENIIEKNISIMKRAYVIFFFDFTFCAAGKGSVEFRTKIYNPVRKRVGYHHESYYDLGHPLVDGPDLFGTVSYHLFEEFTSPQEFSLTVEAEFFSWPDKFFKVRYIDYEVTIIACRSLQNFLTLVDN